MIKLLINNSSNISNNKNDVLNFRIKTTFLLKLKSGMKSIASIEKCDACYGLLE